MASSDAQFFPSPHMSQHLSHHMSGTPYGQHPMSGHSRPPMDRRGLIGSHARSNSSLSSRTHLVIQEIERLKSENERMKKASGAFELQQYPMNPQQYAADTKARREEIKMMIMKAQELDLCFLLDATASMQVMDKIRSWQRLVTPHDGYLWMSSWCGLFTDVFAEVNDSFVIAKDLILACAWMQDSIDMVKDKVAAMASGINAAYPECSLRVSFVLYRDYDDPNTDSDKGCNFTTDFSGSKSTFIRALSAVKAKGGADAAEDVFTGLQRVANLDWQARNRLLVHICDAPCHGTQFHDFPTGKLAEWDNYPNGDKFGRDIKNLLKQLRTHCQVTHYYFCHLNDGTKKMLQEFNKVIGEEGWIEEAHFRDIKNIPQNVVSMSRSTISKTMSNLSAGIGSHANAFIGTHFIPESVVQSRPNWESIAVLKGQQYKHKWYHFLDELLKKISNRESFEVEEMDSLLVQIATHPFSAEGTMRWPYHAAVLQPDQAARNMVVKRFKVPFGQSVRLVHSKERYLSQMEVQTVAAHMAHEFNHRTQSGGLRGVKKVEFTLVSTLQVGSKIYNMEKFLEGNWIRYSNNAGYVNTAEYAATLQAFTHWTHERSGGMLMVTDLQGVAQPTGNGGKYMFWLCDPSIHCLDVMRFTRTNLGEDGFKLFFNSHKCNDICRHLGLKAPNGYSTVGTQVDID